MTKVQEPKIRFIIKQGADGLFHLRSVKWKWNQYHTEKLTEFDLISKHDSMEQAIEGMKLSLNAIPRYWDKDGNEVDPNGDPIEVKKATTKKGKK